MNNENTNKDYELEWVFARYENGDNVADIARKLDKSESYVYSRMQRVPEKYEDVKRIREEMHSTRIKRVRGLADKIVLGYLEDIESDKEKATDAIDRVNRIAKDYAHRVQLAEGKNTENYGVSGKDGLPFQVIITKTYENEATDPDFKSNEDQADEIDELLGE